VALILMQTRFSVRNAGQTRIFSQLRVLDWAAGAFCLCYGPFWR
jgi:hypothetical protein